MAAETVNHHRTEPDPVIKRFDSAQRATLRGDVVLPSPAVMSFAEKVLDVSRGIEAVATILDKDDTAKLAVADEEDGARPILTVNDRDALTRFVAASSALLQKEAEGLMQWAYEMHTPEGQQDRIGAASRAAGLHELGANHG